MGELIEDQSSGISTGFIHGRCEKNY